MSTKRFSIRNLRFMLYEVFNVLELTRHTYFSKHTQEGFDMVLETADSIAEKYMRPFLKAADRNPPQLVNGKVHVHEALHNYYHKFCESGLLSSTFDEKYGGSQIPNTVYAAADFIIGNAHNGFEMFTGLASGAARLLITFSSEELIDQYASRILAGDWAATMCLTEPQAGSSLSNIRTTAVRQPDGLYKLKGHKIFISAGDHDITPNIVHLVLGRIQGSAGSKGISLFLVPVKRIEKATSTQNGNSILIDNDVTSIGIAHKMGQRSTPAMQLEFGNEDKCIGYLIGEEGKGLSYMFQMMNTARLGVGLAGSYISTAAYYESLEYSKMRLQGKRQKTPFAADGEQAAIIGHPDVRRMLFLQKALSEGSLALVMQCYMYTDLVQTSSDKDRVRYQDLLELLTPVAKTVGAEMGAVSVNNGLQVLGGYGYTEDFILEQLARDIRIMSLYEGTTGIQAQALLGRQIPANDGRSFQYWIDEVSKVILEAKHIPELRHYGDWLLKEVQALDMTTEHLLNIESRGNREVFLSDANLYIEVFGAVAVAWQWLNQGIVALRHLKDGQGESVNDRLFYESKVETMRFYFHYELRKTKGLHERLRDESVITVAPRKEILV